MDGGSGQQDDWLSRVMTSIRQNPALLPVISQQLQQTLAASIPNFNANQLSFQQLAQVAQAAQTAQLPVQQQPVSRVQTAPVVIVTQQQPPPPPPQSTSQSQSHQQQLQQMAIATSSSHFQSPQHQSQHQTTSNQLAGLQNLTGINTSTLLQQLVEQQNVRMQQLQQLQTGASFQMTPQQAALAQQILIQNGQYAPLNQLMMLQQQQQMQAAQQQQQQQEQIRQQQLQQLQQLQQQQLQQQEHAQAQAQAQVQAQLQQHQQAAQLAALQAQQRKAEEMRQAALVSQATAQATAQLRQAQAAAVEASIASSLPQQVQPAIQATFASQPATLMAVTRPSEESVENQQKYFSILLKMADGGPGAPFIKGPSPSGQDDIRSFTSKLQAQNEQLTDKDAISSLTQLQARCSSLSNYCRNLFPRIGVALAIRGEPPLWPLPMPHDVSHHTVRMVAATLEYKKKLSEVKILHDWIEFVARAGNQSPFHALFTRQFPNPAAARVLVEKAIENVSCEWADARMRLVDHFSYGFFRTDKRNLATPAARVLITEVDKLCVIDPVQPNEASVANGKFVHGTHQSLPVWIPYTAEDLVANSANPPAQQIQLAALPAPLASLAPSLYLDFNMVYKQGLATSQPPSSVLASAPFTSVIQGPSTSAFQQPSTSSVPDYESGPSTSKLPDTVTALPIIVAGDKRPADQASPIMGTPSKKRSMVVQEDLRQVIEERGPSWLEKLKKIDEEKERKEQQAQSDVLSGTLSRGLEQCESLSSELHEVERKKNGLIKDQVELIRSKLELRKKIEALRGGEGKENEIAEMEAKLEFLSKKSQEMDEHCTKYTLRIAQIRKVTQNRIVDVEQIAQEISMRDQTRKEQMLQLGLLTSNIETNRRTSPPSNNDNKERPSSSGSDPGASSSSAPDLSHSLSLLAKQADAPTTKKNPVLLDIVERMKTDKRFRDLNFKMRMEIALAQLFLKGHKGEGEGGEFKVDDTKGHEITKEIMSKIIGAQDPNNGEFCQNLSIIVNCVEGDADIQRRMTKILNNMNEIVIPPQLESVLEEPSSSKASPNDHTPSETASQTPAETIASTSSETPASCSSAGLTIVEDP